MTPSGSPRTPSRPTSPIWSALSHAIHAHPELSFEEVRSSALAAEALERGGFRVTTGTAGLPTAFAAEAGDGPLVLAICAEYDALPDVGHACGHNIIAASAVGAGLGLLPLADQLGLTVRVLGTPAEEGGGGKMVMLDPGRVRRRPRGDDGPPVADRAPGGDLPGRSHFDVDFTGRTAHASAAPWQGINAGDAMVVAQVALGLLRQQLPPGRPAPRRGHPRRRGRQHHPGPGDRPVHGPIPDDRGARTARSRGCGPASRPGPGPPGPRSPSPRSPRTTPTWRATRICSACYRANAEALGRRFDLDDEGAPRPTLSTDMANVSLAVPTIHPLMAIESAGAVNHQPEFAAACITPSADTAVRDGALAMAWTAIDAAVPGPLRERLLAGRTG